MCANNAANVVWTPTVNYTYDQGGAYSLGHLAKSRRSGAIDQKFTGKERHMESGLDHFGLALQLKRVF